MRTSRGAVCDTKAGGLVREPDAGDLHVRFDERDVETGAMVEPVRHRQTKEAGTDMFESKAAAPHLGSTATKIPGASQARFKPKAIGAC